MRHNPLSPNQRGKCPTVTLSTSPTTLQPSALRASLHLLRLPRLPLIACYHIWKLSMDAERFLVVLGIDLFKRSGTCFQLENATFSTNVTSMSSFLGRRERPFLQCV